MSVPKKIGTPLSYTTFTLLYKKKKQIRELKISTKL